MFLKLQLGITSAQYTLVDKVDWIPVWGPVKDDSQSNKYYNHVMDLDHIPFWENDSGCHLIVAWMVHEPICRQLRLDPARLDQLLKHGAVLVFGGPVG